MKFVSRKNFAKEIEALAESYNEVYWLTYNLSDIENPFGDKLRLLVSNSVSGCNSDDKEKGENAKIKKSKEFNYTKWARDLGDMLFWVKGKNKSKSGTVSKFHPKVLFFVNSEKDWAAIIGSSNSVRSNLFEASVYFDNTDVCDADNGETLFDVLKNLMLKIWKHNIIPIESRRINHNEMLVRWDVLMKSSCLNGEV